jgi:DNA-binding CsgD family transcriptional regulator
MLGVQTFLIVPSPIGRHPDKRPDSRLRKRLDFLSSSESSPEVRSFPARDAEAEVTMVAHVIPIRLSARDIFVPCFAVLVFTPVTRPQAPPVELVQSLFDLTPAEARVACSLASGKTISTVATEGVSPETVRTHVRRVLAKTGCERQVEIVALPNSVARSSTVTDKERSDSPGRQINHHCLVQARHWQPEPRAIFNAAVLNTGTFVMESLANPWDDLFPTFEQHVDFTQLMQSQGSVTSTSLLCFQ